jgi:hypothetical protein
MDNACTDTDASTERVLVDAIRRAPVWKRLALASSLIETTRALALADLRAQFPAAADEELRRRLALRLLTHQEIRDAYGWDPETLEG